MFFLCFRKTLLQGTLFKELQRKLPIPKQEDFYSYKLIKTNNFSYIVFFLNSSNLCYYLFVLVGFQLTSSNIKTFGLISFGNVCSLNISIKALFNKKLALLL